MKYFLILLTTLVVKESQAQTAGDSVKTVINQMFAAMKNADTAALRATFTGTVIFQTVARGNGGEAVVKNEELEEFMAQVSRSAPGALDEQIVFDVVKTDGALAIAWTPYKFYYKGAFSHCGVNSFQLVRVKEGWKIQYIIDTRRRAGCEE